MHEPALHETELHKPKQGIRHSWYRYHERRAHCLSERFCHSLASNLPPTLLCRHRGVGAHREGGARLGRLAGHVAEVAPACAFAAA
eukprot:9409853-Alexandrium_andersonii.AAC.1